MKTGKVIYRAKTHTTGGRDRGTSRSTDGRLDVELATPGTTRTGTNPEQLFAAGWSSCFVSAIALAARQAKQILPGEISVDAEVSLHKANGDYFLSAILNVNLPGVAPEVAKDLVNRAQRICPYSKATSGNIDVAINMI
jgi:lipoyl-dependent peroxiredoxin